MKKLKENDVIETIVTGIQKYGAFVDINDEYNGLIHISEISYGYVKNVGDYIKIGEKIYAQVLDVDNENSKVKLSIKNIDYKNDGKVIRKITESKNGFAPLKEHLDSWIDEKIREFVNKM